MLEPKLITSTANPAVREVARLGRKRNRHELRQFIIEGEDLLDAALSRGMVPRQVFVLAGEEEGLIERLEEKAMARPGRARQDYAMFTCSRAVLDKLSGLGSGSRLIAVFNMMDQKFPGTAGVKPGASAGPMLYLSGVGDPGNVGTLIRSAAALGAVGVALGPGTADPYAPKALRATMGAIFQIPFFLTVNPEALVSWADRAEAAVICTDSHRGTPVWERSLSGNFALILGQEREGIPHRLLDAASETVRIPQTGETESINVAMAGTAILYEAMKQRQTGQPPTPAP
ncbi:MAG: TrmH family RNA methyltransferase [Thermoleophilia bacterium]